MPKSNTKKRTAGDVDIANSVDQVDLPHGWIDKLFESDDLAFIIGEIVNRAQLSASAIKKARSDLPSFAKWSELAPDFSLPDDVSLAITELDSFMIPVVHLPPSFHVTSFQVAWRVQDVYQERSAQNREVARIRVFDAVLPAPAEFCLYADCHAS